MPRDPTAPEAPPALAPPTLAPPPGVLPEGVLPEGAAADVVEETLDLGGHEVRLLRPRDGEALLDEFLALDTEDEARLPFWAEMWPSGVALARAVAARGPAGLRVLELGCGLGLVSVTAALSGGRVLAVDRAPDAVAFTQVNAARNHAELRAAVCAFDAPEPLLAEAPWDLVLAADVLYDEANLPVLLELLPRLTGATGEVWLADPERRLLGAFLDGVDAAGWRREPRAAEGQVVIHCLRRPARR
jgi:predicted nicotinamide N-methyase